MEERCVGLPPEVRHSRQVLQPSGSDRSGVKTTVTGPGQHGERGQKNVLIHDRIQHRIPEAQPACLSGRQSTGEDSGYKDFPSWTMPPEGALRTSWRRRAVAAKALKGVATWPDRSSDGVATCTVAAASQTDLAVSRRFSARPRLSCDAGSSNKPGSRVRALLYIAQNDLHTSFAVSPRYRKPRF